MKKLEICTFVLLIYTIFLVYIINSINAITLCTLLGLFLVLVYISERVYRSEEKCWIL